MTLIPFGSSMNPFSSKLIKEDTGACTEILHPGISLFIFSRVTLSNIE